MKKLQRAIKFATEKHRDQKRVFDGTPYINHPIAVMKLVRKIIKDEDVLCAAVLHDVVEDCGVKLSEIEKLFGKKVAKLVKELSNNYTPYEKIRSKEALIIKMADSLHNTMGIAGKRKLYYLQRRQRKIKKTFFDD